MPAPQICRWFSAEAYVSAYLPVFGYIPKPAEEDYGPRIDRREVWILECNGSAVGIAVLEERPDHLLVYSIAVKPTEQRQGYGSAFLDFADQRAAMIGVKEIRLYTNLRMEKNAPFIAGTVTSRSAPARIRAERVKCSSTWCTRWPRGCRNEP